MIEIWKDIPGLIGYQASTFGNIRSLDRIIDMFRSGKWQKIPIKGRVLTPMVDKQGYLFVQFSRKNKKMHRIVASVFHANPQNKRCVNHINGIKSDNRVDNLEWVTHGENALHALKIGLKKPQQLGKSGKLHTRSKPVISIKDTAIIEHESRNLCAMYLGVDNGTITNAINKGTICKGHRLYAA